MVVSNLLGLDCLVGGGHAENSIYSHTEFDRHKRAVDLHVLIRDLETLAYGLVQCGEASSANTLFMAVASIQKLQKRNSRENLVDRTFSKG